MAKVKVTKRVHKDGKSKVVKKLPVFDKKVNKLAKKTAAQANKKKS